MEDRARCRTIVPAELPARACGAARRGVREPARARRAARLHRHHRARAPTASPRRSCANAVAAGSPGPALPTGEARTSWTTLSYSVDVLGAARARRLAGGAGPEALRRHRDPGVQAAGFCCPTWKGVDTVVRAGGHRQAQGGHRPRTRTRKLERFEVVRHSAEDRRVVGSGLAVRAATCAAASARRSACFARGSAESVPRPACCRAAPWSTTNYGRVTGAVPWIPIEKKPLAMYRPGLLCAVGGLLRLQPALPVLPERLHRLRWRGRRTLARPWAPSSWPMRPRACARGATSGSPSPTTSRSWATSSSGTAAHGRARSGAWPTSWSSQRLRVDPRWWRELAAARRRRQHRPQGLRAGLLRPRGRQARYRQAAPSSLWRRTSHLPPGGDHPRDPRHERRRGGDRRRGPLAGLPRPAPSPTT